MASIETTDRPTVSIVIVTSDRYDDLLHCLTELHTHLAKPGTPSAEVITVHGPNDGAAIEMVTSEFPQVRVLHSKQRHISRQRNLGALAANGPVLWWSTSMTMRGRETTGCTNCTQHSQTNA